MRTMILFSIFGSLFGCGTQAGSGDPIDYDQAYALDAEELAEGGIAEAYGWVVAGEGDALPYDDRPKLTDFVALPLAVTERIDDPMDLNESVEESYGTYVVEAGSVTYNVWQGEPYEAWGYAPYVLFDVINRQLAEADAPVRFYALYGANDLLGLFLTEDEYARARRFHRSEPTEQPYIPASTPPDFGASVSR